MTEGEILDEILAREGGFVNHPMDKGGPTNFGITARTLGEWRNLGRRATWREVQALTREEALQIYRRRYIENPGFTPDVFPHDGLRAILIDHGVLSGPFTAIKDLQEVLNIEADGVIGPRTRAALLLADHERVCTALAKARIVRFVRIAQGDPSQLAFLAGWVNRGLAFLG
jgi:lysozyme family protein